jgi:AcrR family transcriptional regulator
MAIVVEHDKRRKAILEKALDVFVEEGFADATYQKIADRCGITRTTLYAYFRNKKEIFNYSIRQLLQKVEGDILQIKSHVKKSCADRLAAILLGILQHLQENRRLLVVLLDYLMYLSRTDSNPDVRVRRRTIKMRHYLSALIIEGVKTKEFAKVNIKTANDFLFSFIEAGIFRLVVLKHESIDELKQSATLAVKQLKR